ncbi:MAG: ATP-binding protein [Bacteroidota bacterium]
MSFKRTSILLIAFCMFYVVAGAQQPADSVYHVNEQIQIHDLKNHTSVLYDSAGNYSVNEIISGEQEHNFQPFAIAAGQHKDRKSYWLKLSVIPKGPINKWYLLLCDTADPYQISQGNSYVDVYSTNARNAMISHQKTGLFVPRSQKAIPAIASVNRVYFSGSQGEIQTIYIRVRNDVATKSFFYPQVQSPAVPIVRKAGGLDIMTAIALVFSVLSFFFYFFVKDKAYLLFGIYTFLFSQHYLILHPEVPFIDLYIPEHPWLSDPFFVLLSGGALTIFLLFGRSFMNLPALSRKTDRIVFWIAVIHLAAVVIEFIYMAYTRLNLLAPAHVIIFMIATFLLTIRFAFFKTFEARVFVAGSLCLFGFSILGMMYGFQIIHLPFNPWPVGQIGQLFIYSFGLAYKIRLNEKAKAEAERIKDLDSIKSKFFANISHEFRTPLTLIQGPLQQIEENIKGKDGTTEVPVRHIKTMRRNTDRLLELVNQMLDLSKLDSGKMKLQVVKGDLLQLLKALSASFESMAERKGIHYHILFPGQTDILFFDKDKLEKIISNLLINAFKYTPEQGTVSVNADIEGGRLRFMVEDNGPGIPKKELDKIFDRFYQVEGTEDKGSGIGLALVKELVDLYRGQISVSSEPGKGCRFKVTLPVGKNLFKENELVYGEWQAEKTFINQSMDEQESWIKKETIAAQLPLLLIVEDNRDLRNFIKEIVHQYYQVVEAANGKEGLVKAISEVPDIIVSDVMMPEMDGFAMTQKLKKDERTSHIPVILLTAKASQDHKLEGLETGADDYLTKPFDAKELLLRLSNLINQRKLLRKKFAGEILLKPSEVAVTSADENFLTKVLAAIEKNMSEEDFGVEELAKAVAMSRSQLHRKLMALTGQAPSETLRNTRLLRAKELLQKKVATPSEVAYQVGFNSHTYFSKCFKEEFGISPGEVK